MRVETLVNRSGCQIIVANQSNLAPQQELVEDILAIIHCFSCRIYGSRHYAKEKVKADISFIKIQKINTRCDKLASIYIA